MTEMRPGLFFNIFGGIVVVVIMGYMLVAETTGLPAGQSFYHFLQWFFMIYTSVQWLVLVAWSLAVEKQKEWLEELKTWAAGVVGVPGTQSLSP